MWLWILKKAFVFLLSAIALILMAFFLLGEAPEENDLQAALTGKSIPSNPQARRTIVRQWRQIHGFEKPVFIFSLKPACVLPAFDSIPIYSERQAVTSWARKTGGGKEALSFYQKLVELENLLHNEFNKKDTISLELKNLTAKILSTSDFELLKVEMNSLKRNCALDTQLNASKCKDSLLIAWYNLINNHFPFRNLIPVLRWHPDCRFLQWFWGSCDSPGLLRGNLGISLKDNRKVNVILFPRFRLTLLLSVLAIVIIFLTGYPAGLLILSAPLFWKKIITTIIYFFYSIPTFWMASLLLILLGGGGLLDIFPSFGMGENQNNLHFWEIIITKIHHLTLPLFCFSYGGFCFMATLTRELAESEYQNFWILAVRAKGISHLRLMLKHVSPVILLSIITTLGQIFPTLMAGAVLIETIFSLPGLGELTFQSVLSGNYPVLMGILLLSIAVTFISFLISDVLCSIISPNFREDLIFYTRL